MISKSVNQFLRFNLKNECSVNSVSRLMVKLVKTFTVLSWIFGIHCKIHQKVEHIKLPGLSISLIYIFAQSFF